MIRIVLLLAMAVMLLPQLSLAQSRTISGTVTDNSGTPLPFVSVQEKGTNKGTTTNDRGQFSIVTTTARPVLVFSYTGLQAQEIAVGTSNTFNVSLSSEGGTMSEVVVTALGITRKERSLGYSTQEVKGENLTLTKEQNVLGSLAGKVAGVQVVGASGASMGGTQKIKIRGVNSIAGTGEPLIVVDGTPISNANFAGRNGGDFGNLGQDVNPEDIAGIVREAELKGDLERMRPGRAGIRRRIVQAIHVREGTQQAIFGNRRAGELPQCREVLVK